MAVLALLAGCADSGDGGSASSDNRTELDIVVWPSGRSGDKEQATLRCSPPGGTLPDPEAACELLDGMKRPFVRPSGQVVCIEIYGGPAVAEIRGTFNGKLVNATFARSDGCEIELWDRHQLLFPAQPGPP